MDNKTGEGDEDEKAFGEGGGKSSQKLD